jgi:hypothetical protein
MNYKWSEYFLRRRAEMKMKSRIPERVWQYFVSDQSVGQVRQNPEELGWLVGQIEKFLAAANLSSKTGPMLQPVETPRRQRRNKVVSARNDTVSEFVAERARHEEGVREFRKRYLNGAVLSPSKVQGWIDTQTYKYSGAVVVRIPRGTQISCGSDGLPRIPTLTSVNREQIEELWTSTASSITDQLPGTSKKGQLDGTAL